MQVRFGGVIYSATKIGNELYSLVYNDKGDTVEVHSDEISEVEIECKVCDKDKWVENGIWALHYGMCERCYCKYQGG